MPLRDAVAAAIGMPVLLDKDVTAAAVAEMWAGGPGGNGTFLVLCLRTGLGAGLVLRGEVVRGVAGNAGELGHIVTDPGGAPCPCGLARIHARRIPALLPEAVAAREIHLVAVVGTAVGENLGAVGAASLVLDAEFSPHPHALVRR